jgi:hypothetical protein
MATTMVQHPIYCHQLVINGQLWIHWMLFLAIEPLGP